MPVHLREIVENFPDLLKAVRVAAGAQVTALRAAANADETSLIFVGSKPHLREALDSKSRSWVVHTDLLGEVPDRVTNLLSTKNVQFAMAAIGKRHFPQVAHHHAIEGDRIHASAQIAATAKLGAGCTIGPGAVISEGCVVAEGCVVGANSVLERGVKLGARTHIHPLVFIGHGCELGADCEVKPNTTIGGEGYGYATDEKFNHHRLTHYGRVIIEDRVHIGSGVQIDRGTFLDSQIGAGTKIDNHCHFGHNIQIGRGTIITAGMITAGSVKIGSYCVFGGRTTIAGHISIGDKVQVSGASVVQKNLDQPGEYGGFPLQELRSALKSRAIIRHLPEMQRQLKKILAHLHLE